MCPKEGKSDKIRRQIKTNVSKDWFTIQNKKMLTLFHEASSRVPAYKDFLKKNKILPEKIKSMDDFHNIPIINKKNYIQKYPLESLCWDGFDNRLTFTATSGSTGQPSYFVRNESLDWQYSISIQRYLENSSTSIKEPTLVIICFGMGIWIGGLITYKAYEIAADRMNLPISIITPGINKKEIFSALKILSPQYKKTILVGYSPFLKDVVDQSSKEGINLKKINLRFMFAAEAVTEEVREYLYDKCCVENIYLDFMNVYGSADIGAMAFEDGLSILIKRLLQSKKNIFYDIFTPINKIPTLAQYNPLFINFESIDSKIILTGDSAIPLIRYSIGDNGGVISYANMKSKLRKHNIDMDYELKRNKLDALTSELPFVYVYERANFSTNLYGLNIYPEWIKRAIISTELKHYLTGKFTLATRYDDDQNQFLEVNVELKKDIIISNKTKERSVRVLTQALQHLSSEYRELLGNLKERAHPRIKFWEAEDPLYFKPGIKQKWIK